MTHGPRELLLLCHGRAAPDALDRARELTDPGKRDIQRVGARLQEASALPDVTLSSSATRATMTAENVLKVAGCGLAGLTVDERIYRGDAGELLEVLADVPGAPHRVMVVGHNPGLSTLASYLALEGQFLSPGMLVRLRMPVDWAELAAGCGAIIECIDPATLPAMFPFPGPGGSELRSRPAYYYKQSGVVPFRQSTAGLQFLVIGAENRSSWMFPRGIITPGYSPQQSAAKEAFSEAGIDGTVLEPMLGQLEFEKWDATVTCAMYPMRVTSMHPEDAWPERHRGRRWVSAADVADILRNGALAQLATTLAERVTKGG